TRRSTGC
ncbi:hypothetical protein ATR1_057d0003, partial [Acetobacter tropicalis]